MNWSRWEEVHTHFVINHVFWSLCYFINFSNHTWKMNNWKTATDHLYFCLLFSHSVVTDSLWPHGLQHYPSPSPRACSNSYLLSWCCHPTILSCYPLLLPSIFSALGSFLVSLLLDDHYFWWDYCIKKLKFIYMSLWKHFWKIYLYSHSDYTTWIYLDYIINFLTEPSNSTVYIFNYLVKENIFWRMLMQFGEGNGTSLWYSCLENPMGGAAW